MAASKAWARKPRANRMRARQPRSAGYGITASMADSRAKRSATQGRATSEMWAFGNTPRMARRAGSDMMASPIQLVERTMRREMAEGLSDTVYSVAGGR